MDCVYLNYKKENQRPLKIIHAAEAADYLNSGQFPPGSMGPKIEAAVSFLKSGGKEVIVTSLDKAKQAILGDAGTKIVR